MLTAPVGARGCIAQSLSDSQLLITCRPQARAYGGRRSPALIWSGHLSQPPWYENEDCLCFTRFTSIFVSITASQKEVTVSHAPSPHIMVWTKTQEVAATDRLHEEMAVLRASKADLYRMLLQTVNKVVTPVESSRRIKLLSYIGTLCLKLKIKKQIITKNKYIFFKSNIM